MGARKYAKILGPLLLALLTGGGCASTGAPDDWLSPAAEAPQDPFGAWVTVEFVESHSEDLLQGEFLAVDSDSLYVLTSFGPTGDPVRAVPLTLIKKARVAHFDPQTGKAAGWVAMGSVSTLSHGLGAGITLPLWLIMGSALAGSHSRTPLEDYPDNTWYELRMYARFPQGPPPGLHHLGLRPKSPGTSEPYAQPPAREFNY